MRIRQLSHITTGCIFQPVGRAPMWVPASSNYMGVSQCFIFLTYIVATWESLGVWEYKLIHGPVLYVCQATIGI
jgi:hypothetical protein